MMVDIRCGTALHFRFDPDTLEVDLKCRNCSRKMGRAVHHRVPLKEFAERVKRGEMVGVCEPTDPRFVHWKVTGS